MNTPLWILIGVCGAVVLLVSPARRRRGGRVIVVLGGLMAVAIVAAAVIHRVESRDSHVRIDWPSWPNVVLPPMPPETNRVAQTIWINELRNSLAEWKAESKEAASGIWTQAHAEIDRVYQSIVVEDGDGMSIMLPPGPGKEVLSFHWDRSASAPRAPQATSGSERRNRGPPRIERGTAIWNILAGLVVAGFLFVGYVFLDAATRGQFTGQLRILSVIAIASAVFGLLFA